ncbi:hypothetical protein D4T97_016635 [Siminovitchia acidinfaciens]|uniref:PepSY domain-containing protein n=1 Tax=Siminovitchia acidinfaciens TaxID=2321395 RepID=A0A429XVH7_9BACI|nr:PepSY domain-containing protein [Siminovitchia acidinfaciens]RST72265.1 hypothetical protein D4T97_016635 [Siminovitchia acidinfaciens]
MKVKALLAVFIVLGISFTLVQIFKKNSSDQITKEEAEQVAVGLYGGKVLSSSVKNENYEIQLDNDKGMYTLVVDGTTKKVSNVKMVEKKMNPLSLDEARKNIEREMNGTVTQINHVEKEGETLSEALVQKNNKTYSIQYDLKKKSIVSRSEKEVKHDSIHNANPDAEAQTSVISEQRAKEIAVEKINGKVTALSEVTKKNGKHYKVTVDGTSDGAHVYIQANTGNISSISWYTKKNNDDGDDGDDGDEDDDDDNDDDD